MLIGNFFENIFSYYLSEQVNVSPNRIFVHYTVFIETVTSWHSSENMKNIKNTGQAGTAILLTINYLSHIAFKKERIFFILKLVSMIINFTFINDILLIYLGNKSSIKMITCRNMYIIIYIVDRHKIINKN
jgi:hypothetical protein